MVETSNNEEITKKIAKITGLTSEKVRETLKDIDLLWGPYRPFSAG